MEDFSMLKSPAMFHPKEEIQFGIAPLAGIDAVITLGHDPFPEVGAKGRITFLEDSPQLQPGTKRENKSAKPEPLASAGRISVGSLKL